MGIMDKVKNLKDATTELAEKAGTVAKSGISQAQNMVNEKMEQSRLSKLPQEGGLKRYEVTYRGGHPEFLLQKKQSPYIVMDIMPDRFSFLPKGNSEDWFTGFEIMYEDIISLEIVERTISSTEFFISGDNNNSDLRQKNVIQITYLDAEGDEYVVRNEMLTGTTVMGQARVCLEMLDFLRVNKILKKFRGNQEQQTQQPQSSSVNDNILESIEKLSKLKDAGILSDEEFVAKKKELLAKL